MKTKRKPDSNFIIVGDMNDSQDSKTLEPFTQDPQLGLTNALKNAQETRPPKPDDPMPATPAWTHRYKPTGQPAKYELYDQIWLSPNLGQKLIEAKIDRRTKHKGDGSDHDPAWITIEI